MEYVTKANIIAAIGILFFLVFYIGIWFILPLDGVVGVHVLLCILNFVAWCGVTGRIT